MASRVLYPPILDSYIPAFAAGTTSHCRVYFSLSKFNSRTDFSSVHVSIVKQNSGLSVVNTNDNAALNHYRATGIILNVKPVLVEGEENLFYIDIENNDLSSIDTNLGYSGWIPGWIYKIQIRLCGAQDYNPSSDAGQAAWLNLNANRFSEWSNVTTTKAIGGITVQIPSLDYDSDKIESQHQEKTLYISTLDFIGKYTCQDITETLYSYQVKLFDSNSILLEESGVIYTNQYCNTNQFNYSFKTEFIDLQNYTVEFTYETINKYKKTVSLNFLVTQVAMESINATIITEETDVNKILKDITSISQEEEEGRICLKLYSNSIVPYSGNICIRRSSSKTNFTLWEDIKIIVCRDKDINSFPCFFDYTIESGVWYKYGVQPISKDGVRGLLTTMQSPVIRNFNYSFLLGENNQQLKLQFNNDMGNFKINMSEGRTDTIGSKYPFITRNGNPNYKTFPVNGLISFNMDENNLFITRDQAYLNKDISMLYENYNSANGIGQYDYNYEKVFRDKVLEFFHNGKPKLFKSPTEGNIIISLMDISCTPNQSLSRMIYSFTSTGYEIAETSMENYLKYNFCAIDAYGTDFSVTESHIGQIQGEFDISENIFKLIHDKYDTDGASIAGYVKKLTKITNVLIKIDDIPLRIKNSAGDIVVGNNILFNNTLITIYGGREYYEFDPEISFTSYDNLRLLGDLDGKVNKIKATIDFIYELENSIYVPKEIKTKTVTRSLGQIFGSFLPGESLYKNIYYKYYLEWPSDFKRMDRISSLEIEANPGAVFLIKDDNDLKGDLHEIGWTNILNFDEIAKISDLQYIGMRMSDGTIDSTRPMDVIVNYRYTLVQGTYKEAI